MAETDGIKQRKALLTTNQQIEHLKSKGVTFKLCSEKDAAEYLANHTYFFKIAAYRILFEKRIGGQYDGQYVDLDFGHLKALASLDRDLRYALLPLTLDVEHAARTKLVCITTERNNEDGYTIARDYTFKDLEICALGCGAGWDGRVDLEYVNEGDAKNPDLKVLPIFAVPLTVNEEMTTTLDYGFDYSGSLHYGIDVHFHAPFKMNDHIETFVTQEAIWDRGEGRGSLSKQVGKSYSADGTHLCTVDTYDCCIYDGGWGGEQPPRDSVEYPDREPDFAYEETYGYNWPLVYRLMGDWHQQHIDWSYTEQTGLERPIAHGVSSAGVAMRHVISLLFPGHPEAMTRFKCRFTSPVLPGVRLRTIVWKTAEGEAKFRMVNADAPDSKPFLNHGIVEWDPARA